MHESNLAIEWWPAGRPQAYPGNPRVITDAAVEQVAQSLRLFGWRQPIVVDGSDVIIVGHTRLKAARKLGMERVPVHIAWDMSPEEAKAYRLADNRVGEATSWDLAALKIELQDLRGVDLELAPLGFDLGGLGLDGDVPGGASRSSSGPAEAHPKLAERFGLPPFTVLNAREGWWQDRKAAWIALGIQSEIGRGDNHLGFSETVLRA